MSTTFDFPRLFADLNRLQKLCVKAQGLGYSGGASESVRQQLAPTLQKLSDQVQRQNAELGELLKFTTKLAESTAPVAQEQFGDSVPTSSQPAQDRPSGSGFGALLKREHGIPIAGVQNSSGRLLSSDDEVWRSAEAWNDERHEVAAPPPPSSNRATVQMSADETQDDIDLEEIQRLSSKNLRREIGEEDLAQMFDDDD